ncbi:hypothetical protein OQ496_07260 [Acetobacter suratthaniensis]|jgi:multidrug transporter EmrE-like cation transporter|uniref:4-amino-4-deoxy-L-arabinose transferase n=1 Tax=Acetobacter suratthaniensis TaxID=1502841 RepID=A0ABS3LKL5_9PROT|nr:hypothetical protein [Acetobacter suratthaniensis]MBO1328131.1 hypothetical protein [Acetobacter suratthaniensis]MCX2566251.1 hypothetical protein [Acetobacter suratthaniensis]
MNPSLFILAVFSVTLNAFAQIFLRKTMLTIGEIPSSASGIPAFLLSIGLNLWFIGGMACYVLSIGVWMAVLRKTEVSLAYPLLSIGYLITAVIGYFFMSEHVNATRVAGIAIICCGIIVISRSA